MQNNNYVEFKKKRDLGEILGDTFAFLRGQLKPFFNTFFKIAGPYLVVFLLCNAFYTYSVGNIINFNLESSDEISSALLIGLSAFLFIISMGVAYAMAQSVTLHYIKSYVENNGATNFEQIKSEVYSTFWKFIGLAFLVGICVLIGLMFCIIPGVYLYVPLTLSFSILIFNKKSVGDAFSDGFSLVKDYWWITFATLLVVGIVVTIAGYAFSVPSAIYMYAKMGVFSAEIDPSNMGDTLIDPIGIVINMISILFQYLLSIITVVAGALIYFDLNERKNLTGTLERIKSLGNTTDY
ncbi:hypothetical protein [Cellulophaga fucicola]|uniref:Membrane domain of glycerophosphoryl diester phosphodiesterase n=1 Tax=Cellulophaga fucicola TaxID=76595 RepID=A0A1K1N2Q1_9FLAO|nr:hypothetical protein [Cellulophaga fucicola]SFW29623.1 hypothetical protein SAMN05660313_01128 [Cellulophaga fucicola]